MQQPIIIPVLMTHAEFAERSGLTIAIIRKLIESRRLRVVKVGSGKNQRRLIPATELAQLEGILGTDVEHRGDDEMIVEAPF